MLHNDSPESDRQDQPDQQDQQDQKSLLGAAWDIPQPSLEQIQRIMQRHDLPEFVARLLSVRGIEQDSIESFLNPTFQKDFPSPFLLQGMDACATDIAAAIGQGKRFAIFGDFDVDGATSSAVLYRFLKHCGIKAPIYIPQRLTEGYGPSEAALKSLRDDGADILLMLDCGTGAYDTIKYGQDIGLQIVILDHHEAGEKLPPAWHVINPKRKDDTSGLDMLAAVGVTFYFCVAVNSKLRESGFYKDNNLPEANLKSLIDLVALGTVCDIVPLTHVNRLLVRSGFKMMDRLQNTGLRALADVAGIEAPFTPYHAGYVLGPRINAGSRVGKSDLGATLFTLPESEENQAKNIAWTLNDCNAKRKDMQAEMEAQAVQMVEDSGAGESNDSPVILLSQEGWHSGLTGLVAGRIKERFTKPTCVICIEDGIAKGSGRSIAGIHLGSAFVEAQEQGIITKGGGHAMAGGFTLPADQIPAFEAFLKDHINKQINGIMPAVSYTIDGIITVRGAQNLSNVKMLHDQVGPFGAAFEEPLFMLQNIRIISADIMGQNHIRLLISDAEGGARMKAVAFSAVGTDMGTAFLKQPQKRYDLIGQLKINSWQGRESAEFHLRDARITSA